MTLYRVTFKNHEGEDKSVQVDAESGTRAMLLVMELYEELRLQNLLNPRQYFHLWRHLHHRRY